MAGNTAAVGDAGWDNPDNPAYIDAVMSHAESEVNGAILAEMAKQMARGAGLDIREVGGGPFVETPYGQRMKLAPPAGYFTLRKTMPPFAPPDPPFIT